MMPGVLSCTKTPTPPYLGRNLDPAYITTLNPEVFQCFFFQGSVSKLLHPGAPLQSPSQVTSRKDLQKIEGFHLKRLLYLALEIRRRFHVLQDAWNIYTYCSTTFLRTHTWWIQRCVCVCFKTVFIINQLNSRFKQCVNETRPPDGLQDATGTRNICELC